MPSRRQERVAKRVVQELVEAFRNLKNVDLGFLTVTKCEMSPDLRHAKVFVSIWGSGEDKERGLKLLKHNAAKLRSMIGRPLGLKVLPELHFEFDESLATADRISRLIRDARSTDVNPAPLTPEEEAALVAAGAPSSHPGDAFKRRPLDDDRDEFDATRRDVEDELLDGDEDPDWRPIDLDELPDDEDEEDDE